MNERKKEDEADQKSDPTISNRSKVVAAIVFVALSAIIVGLLVALLLQLSENKQLREQAAATTTITTTADALDGSSTAGERGKVITDVVVIGGGFGGLNVADALLQYSTTRGSTPLVTTVVEAKSVVGGRAIDIRFKDAPDVWVGMGPWRVIFDQYLAHELINRFELQTMPFNIDTGPSLMMARGYRSTNKTEIAMERFFTDDPSKGFVDSMLEAMQEAMVADDYEYSAGHKSFITHLNGGEGWEQYKLNFHSYRGEYDLFSVVDELFAGFRRLFPLAGQERVDAVQTIVGGWSVLANALKESIDSHEQGNVILDTTVTAVNYNKDADLYEVQVVDNESGEESMIETKKVIFSVPKSAMANIGGSIGDAIQATEGYASVAPYPVAKAAAVWEDPWWESILDDDDGDGVYKQIQGFSECFRMIPYNFPTNYSAHVVHTAYTGEECAGLIRQLTELPREVADEEMIRHLERMFPEFAGEIPKPMDSAYIFHDGGWHFNWPRTMTHAQTHEWALDPIPGGKHTGRVMMVAEAWARARGWVEAALDLGADALERHFNINMRPLDAEEGSLGTREYWPAKEPLPVEWPERYFGNISIGEGRVDGGSLRRVQKTNKKAQVDIVEQWKTVLQDPKMRSAIENLVGGNLAM